MLNILIKSHLYEEEKVKTKEELLELLYKYKVILKNEMIDYLNSLINLEFSIMRKYINNSERQALSELEIYKNIAIYNIYYRAMNLFNKEQNKFCIDGNNQGIKGLNVSAILNNGSQIELFAFNYGMEYPKDSIGDIHLYRTIANKKLTKMLSENYRKSYKTAQEWYLKQEKEKLSMVYFEKGRIPEKISPLISPVNVDYKKIENETLKQFYQNNEQLNETNYNSRVDLTEFEKEEIKITNEMYYKILEDFGLLDELNTIENKMFEDEKYELVQNMPKLTLSFHTTYK